MSSPPPPPPPSPPCCSGSSCSPNSSTTARRPARSELRRRTTVCFRRPSASQTQRLSAASLSVVSGSDGRRQLVAHADPHQVPQSDRQTGESCSGSAPLQPLPRLHKAAFLHSQRSLWKAAGRTSGRSTREMFYYRAVL